MKQKSNTMGRYTHNTVALEGYYLSFSKKVKAICSDFLEDEEKTTLVIHGPAGVGKSTLLENEVLLKIPSRKQLFHWQFCPDNSQYNQRVFYALLCFCLGLEHRKFNDIKAIKRAIQKAPLSDQEKEEAFLFMGIGSKENTDTKKCDFSFLEALLSYQEDVYLVFEDFHFANESFVGFLEGMPNKALPKVIFATRDISIPYFKAMDDNADFVKLNIWSKSRATRYLKHSLGRETREEDLKVLIQKTHRNPFLLSLAVKNTEIVNESENLSSIALRAVKKEIEEDYRIINDTFSLLSDNQKKVIIAAACSGFRFSKEAIQYASDLSKSLFDEAFNDLQDKKLISLQNSNNIFKFCHHMFYEFVIKNARALDKKNICLRLFRFYRSDASAVKDWSKLSYYALMAEKNSYACFCLLKAAEEHFQNQNFNFVIASLRQSLEIIQALSKSEKITKRMLSPLLMLIQALDITGQYQESQKYLSSLLELEDGLSLEQKREVLHQKTMSHWTNSELSEALKYADAGLSLLEKDKADSITIAFLNRKSAILSEMGSYSEALLIEKMAMELIPKNKRKSSLKTYALTYPGLLSMCSRNHSEIGKTNEALELCEEASTYMGIDQFTDIYVASYVGQTLNTLCQFGDSIEILEKALYAPGADESKIMKPVALSVLGSSYCYEGYVEKGLQAINQAVEIVKSTGQKHKSALINYYLLEAQLFQFIHSDFEVRLEAEIKDANDREQFGSLGWLYFLGAVYKSFHTPFRHKRQNSAIGYIAHGQFIAHEHGMEMLKRNFDYILDSGLVKQFPQKDCFANTNTVNDTDNLKAKTLVEHFSKIRMIG